MKLLRKNTKCSWLLSGTFSNPQGGPLLTFCKIRRLRSHWISLDIPHDTIGQKMETALKTRLWWEYENNLCVPASCRIGKNQQHNWLHLRYCNSKSSYPQVSMNIINKREDFFEECNAYQCFPIHWAMVLSVYLSLSVLNAQCDSSIGLCRPTFWN